MIKGYYVLIFLILMKLVLQQFLIAPGWELHRDEYMHLDQAKHLAWGYLSVPPLTSWVSWIIHQLGNGTFWIKFFPSLFGALTMLFTWKIVEELKGGIFAATLACIAVMFSVIARLNILYQPNSFDVLAWTALYYVLIRYFNTKHSQLLYTAAFIFALGFLNKYNIAFMIIGIIPALLFTAQREVFSAKHLYLAGLFALVLILPNLWWQYKNNFPVVHHMNELTRTQLVNVQLADFLKEQLLFFLGSIFLIVAAFISLLFYQPFKRFRFVIWSFIFTMALFIYLRAKGYYTIGLYPVLLAFGAVYLSTFMDSHRHKWLRVSALLIPAIMFVPFAHLAFPIYTPNETTKHADAYKAAGLSRWEDGNDHHLPQDFADMLGWKELASQVDSVYRRASLNGTTIVITDNYGQAGAINYYSAFENINAVSFNADYINWFMLDKPIKNVILVKDIFDTDTARTEELPYFSAINLVGTIDHPLARERGTKIYLLTDAKVNINAILRKEVDERNNSIMQ